MPAQRCGENLIVKSSDAFSGAMQVVLEWALTAQNQRGYGHEENHYPGSIHPDDGKLCD